MILNMVMFVQFHKSGHNDNDFSYDVHYEQ